MLIESTILNSKTEDFDVFYFSAQRALRNEAIYDVYGASRLPYWYFPWLAWFYIPLAFFSYKIAYFIYSIVSLICAGVSINFLFQRMSSHVSCYQRVFALCMSLLLCWLLFRVGQMDFILLAVATIAMHYIDTHKPHLAGLLTPILIFKPHLFIVFFAYLIYKGGKLFVSSATTATLAVIAISFIIIPDFPLRMIQLLERSGQRTDHSWNFTTLPNLLGSQENWSGTANLPFTFLLIIISLLIIWKIRRLETLPLLSIALAGSLFCAPRAYAYNFPLLIPALIWFSSGFSKPVFIIFWITIAISPFILEFSTGAYLIVLATFIAICFKAMHQQLVIQMIKVGF